MADCSNHVAADDEAARTISKELTRIVEGFLDASGHNLTSFSKALGYSRVRISQVMNCTDGEYLWRLPMICGAARVFQIPVVDLFRLACGDSDVSLGELTERAAHSAPPGSPDRLRGFIAYTLRTYSRMLDAPEYEPDKQGEYEVRFRCTPGEIRYGAPRFWEDFCSGVLREEFIPNTLWKAISYADANGGLQKVPFWAGLNRTYRGK